jgi:acyl-CoA thioesterase-2
MNEVVDLLKLLDLEPIEVNLFRGKSPESRVRRVFGGQVIAQGLVAACRTVENRLPHSLHAYFILGGDPSVPIIYEVGRLRDGRSFTTRRVTAIQHGQAIFSMIVSFHNNEDGYDHQIGMPDVPPPEDIDVEKMLRDAPADEIPASLRRILTNRDGVEIRPTSLDRYLSNAEPRDAYAVWMRANLPIGDDPAMHQSVMAYISDMGLLDVSLARYHTSIFKGEISAASLDHAIWFHRQFRADEWLLYSQDSPNANGGRGLTRGSFFRRDGTLVASVAQEGLIRRKRIP